jgi:ATP-dependent DNA helicase RecG
MQEHQFCWFEYPKQWSNPYIGAASPLKTWIRSGGTTRKASRQETGALMLNSAPARWEELRASPLLPLAQVKELLDLGAIAQLLERPLPEDDDSLVRWLTDEGLTTLEGRGHYITHFGAMAAARQLKDFPELTRKAIRVIHYQGTNKVDTLDERMGQRGYAVGFESLIAYLKKISSVRLNRVNLQRKPILAWPSGRFYLVPI